MAVSDDDDPKDELVRVNYIQRLLDVVWDNVIATDSSWNPDKSCYDLLAEYRGSGRTIDECVENLIDWQTGKAAAGGFVLGMPGLAFGAITIPADLTYTTYLQLRMVATIALLRGWDIKSERIKTIALLSLIGSEAASAIRMTGTQIGTKITAAALAKVPGKVLIEINKAVGFRLITKAGTKGAINIVRIVPVIGGLVSGGLNGYLTRQIGYYADRILRSGPGPIAGEESS